MLGLVLDNYTLYTKATPPYSYTSISTYTNRGNCGVSSSSKTFYKACKWNRNGQLPYYDGTEGSQTTYDCDELFVYSGTMKIACVGGGYYYSTSAGASCVRLNTAATGSDSSIGASPLLKP
jgi:hypothetical protein